MTSGSQGRRGGSRQAATVEITHKPKGRSAAIDTRPAAGRWQAVESAWREEMRRLREIEALLKDRG